MDWTQTTMTVVEYHNAYLRGEIEVNSTYQRSDRVWPDAAKSFLIESLILNFPIPKLSLHQVTDLARRVSRKEVVDGQQRSKAIWGYLDGKYPLSSKSEIEDAAGCFYEDLPEEYQQSLLDYTLPFDLYLAANEFDVREAFRRINSFTAPLNAEEQRHAQFQGPFKWFVYYVAKEHATEIASIGTFTDKQIVRMADAKWISEVTHALVHGITTTNKASLDKLYRDNERAFVDEVTFRARFDTIFRELWSWEELHKTTLMKPFFAYSLALAITHVTNPVESLQSVYPLERAEVINRDIALANLSELTEAVDAPDGVDLGETRTFVSASQTGTNVKAARETRFKWFCNALRGTMQ